MATPLAEAHSSWSVGHISSDEVPTRRGPVFALVGTPGLVRLTARGIGAVPPKWCPGPEEGCPAWYESDPHGECPVCGGRRWKRGSVEAWSRKSRQRLLRTLASVDFRAVSPNWMLVSLTYPREFPRNPRAWKRHLSALRLRWRRRFGADPRGFVVLEWQQARDDGANAGEHAPHWHALWIAPEGEGLEEVERWMQIAWHSVVAGRTHGANCFPDVTTEGARLPMLSLTDGSAIPCVWHLAGGAKVDEADSHAASRYLTREIGKGRQKELPPEWAGVGIGRWWMKWGDVPAAEVSREVTREEYELLRSWLRRVAHARGYHFEAESRWQGLTLFDRTGPRLWRIRRGRQGPPPPDDLVRATGEVFFSGEGGAFFARVITRLTLARSSRRIRQRMVRRLSRSWACPDQACPSRTLPSNVSVLR